MRSPYARGVVAQVIALVSTVGIQVVQVPIFIATVGTEQFGAYLIVIAVPSILVFADFGLLGASSTKMLSSLSGNREADATAVSAFTNTILLILLPLLTLAVVGASLLINMSQPGMSETLARSIFIAFSAYALLCLYSSWMESIMRAAGRYPLGWNVLSSIRVAEFVAGMTVLVISSNIFLSVIAMAATRALGVVALGILSKKTAPWVVWRPTRLDGAIAKELTRPALGSMAQPIGNAFVWQGVVVVVGTILGPTPVVVLTTVRTLVNSLRQVSMVFLNAATPGLTQTLAQGNYGLARTIHVRVGITVGGLVAVGSVGLLAVGPWIIDVWTGGAVDVSTSLIALFVLQSCLEIIWLTAAMWLIAKNEHFAFSVTYALSSFAMVLALAVIGSPDLALVPILHSASSLIVLASVLVSLAWERQHRHPITEVARS